MSPEEKRTRQLQKLGEAFVRRNIEKRIHALLDRVRATRLNAREPENVVIYGETGVGKSYIVETYLLARRHSERDVDGCLRQDLIHVELEGATSPIGIAAEFAKQLGMANLPRGRTAADAGPLTQAVKHQMLAQGVEMVIIDEFHHIAQNRGSVTAQNVGRWVKSLAKKKERTRESPFGVREANIPIVMVGTRSVHDLVKADRELWSITPNFIEVGRFRHDTPAAQAEWQQMLVELDKKLPFDDFSRLGAPEMAFKIHQVTFGFLRQLGQLVGEAGALAIERGNPCILEEDLHDAVENKRVLLESARLSADSETDGRRKPVGNPFDGGDLEALRRRGVLEDAGGF